jgi:hypothetical protein
MQRIGFYFIPLPKIAGNEPVLKKTGVFNQKHFVL